MKVFRPQTLKLFTVMALALVSVPVTIFALWIKATGMGDTQAERVSAFYAMLPEFLHGRWNATILSIAFCILVILLSRMGLLLNVRGWRMLNVLLLTVSGVLLFLNLFSMM